MNDTEHKAWKDGQRHGTNAVVVELLKSTDKIAVIHALFGKASELATKSDNRQESERLEAYSEGFRHALNILKNYGDALTTYQNITNPSIKIELTQEDVRRYS